MQLLLLVFGAIVVILIGWAIFSAVGESQKKRKAQERDLRYYNEYQGWVARYKADGGIVPVECPFLLKKGEQCFAYKQSVSLYESRTKYEHVPTGFMVDVGSGVEVGFGKIKTIATDQMKLVDKGELSVTDQCVYFNGAKLNRVIPLEDIYSIQANYSCFQIGSRTERRKLVFNRVNGLVFRATIQLLIGELQGNEGAETEV